MGMHRPSADSRPRTIRTLMVLALLTAAAPLSVDIYTPSLPLIRREFEVGTWIAEASVTACLLGIAAGQLLWGPLSDRFGRRPVVLIGAIGWTATSAASALAPTASVLLVVRIAAGLCGAAGIVVARSIVRDLSGDTRTVASRIGMLSVVTGLAPIVAPSARAGIAHLWSWRGDFAVLAVFGVGIALAFVVFVPETLPREDRMLDSGRTVARALVEATRNRQLAGSALAIGVFSIGFYAYIAGASFIVEDEFGHPPSVFALVFATNAVAMLAANLVFRVVVRTRHPSSALGAGLLACGIGGMLLLAATLLGAPEWMLWLASTLFAGGAGFVIPGAHSWGQATLVASGVASAFTGSAQFLGGVLGSPATGVFGVTAAHLGVVIAASAGLALVAWAVAARRRVVD